MCANGCLQRVSGLLKMQFAGRTALKVLPKRLFFFFTEPVHCFFRECVGRDVARGDAVLLTEMFDTNTTCDSHGFGCRLNHAVSRTSHYLGHSGGFALAPLLGFFDDPLGGLENSMRDGSEVIAHTGCGMWITREKALEEVVVHCREYDKP